MSKLSEVAANYVAHKQSMGMRFRTEACTLKSFCRAMGEVILHEVTMTATAPTGAAGFSWCPRPPVW
jgi:hypothetical protein